MGAVISFEVDEEDEASFADLPWLVTFEPDDDEAGQQWDAFSCGPYLRDHALAIAEAVAFEQEGVIAVVSPVLPALTPDDVTAMIEERIAEAAAADFEDDDEDEVEDDVDEIEDVEVEDVDEEDEEDEEDEDDADEAEFDEAEFDDVEDDEDDDEDDDDLDVIEVDVEEVEVPLPEDVRAGIETVLQRLLAHTAPAVQAESA